MDSVIVPDNYYDDNSRYPGDDGTKLLHERLKDYHGVSGIDRGEAHANVRGAIINAAILYDGMSVEAVETKFGVQPRLTVQAIAMHNLRMFSEVMEDEKKPYRVIYDAMNATKTERRTTKHKEDRVLPGGRVVEVTVCKTEYVIVPDHAERRAAANQWAVLCGMDPRIAKSVRIQQGNTVIDIGAVYLDIMSNPEGDMESAYNNAVNAERRSGFLLPDTTK